MIRDADWAVLDGLDGLGGLPAPGAAYCASGAGFGVPAAASGQSPVPSAAEPMDSLPPLPTPLPENRFGGDEEVGGPLAVKRFGVDELEVEAFPSVGASAAEPPVSEELVQRLDPPVSGVMDSPLVLLFAFFSWKWRKKLVQLMAVFGREGGLAKEMAGLLVDAQESGNAATATDNVNMMFCAQSSAYFTRSRCEQNQHVPMSAALDAPASWLVRRPSLLRCCSWAAWLAA